MKFYQKLTENEWKRGTNRMFLFHKINTLSLHRYCFWWVDGSYTLKQKNIKKKNQFFVVVGTFQNNQPTKTTSKNQINLKKKKKPYGAHVQIESKSDWILGQRSSQNNNKKGRKEGNCIWSVWFNVEGEGQILFFKIPKKRGHCTVVVVVVTTFKDRNQKTKQKNGSTRCV